MSKRIRNQKNKCRSNILFCESTSLIIGVMPIKEFDNVFKLVILDQDESLRTTLIVGEEHYTSISYPTFIIRSDAYPQFYHGDENTLYLRGDSREQDYKIFRIGRREFDTIFLPGLNGWKKVRIISNKKYIESYVKTRDILKKLNYKFDKLLVL